MDEPTRSRHLPLSAEQIDQLFAKIVSDCEATRFKNKTRAMERFKAKIYAAEAEGAEAAAVKAAVAEAAETAAVEFVAHAAEERVVEERDTTNTLTTDISMIDLNDSA